MKDIRSVRLKQNTIELLDKIAKLKIEKAIEDKTLDIMHLVKHKRGISYDKEINYLARFYLTCLTKFEKIPKSEKNNTILKQILKKMNKINQIC